MDETKQRSVSFVQPISALGNLYLSTGSSSGRDRGVRPLTPTQVTNSLEVFGFSTWNDLEPSKIYLLRYIKILDAKLI